MKAIKHRLVQAGGNRPMRDIHQENKVAVRKLCRQLYDFDEKSVRATLASLMARDSVCHFFHPFGDLTGEQLYDRVFAPLVAALPDVERRDVICIAGADEGGQNWVGCAGHYAGRFMAPFLDMPPTGHIAYIRFHEFYHLVDGKIAEIQAVWDLPDLMMQSGVWPMGPSLGREGFVPGPAGQDGLNQTAVDNAQTHANLNQVLNMLIAMQRHPSQGGPEIMEMEKYWHPHFNWYGPSAIGSARGIEGFRRWHQAPFLRAMPDRGQYPEETAPHFFAEGAFVGVTGWPDMSQTLVADGWLGIAPSNKKVTLRSLDFWRLEHGLIRENWVLVDLLDLWLQLGVDVLARMAEIASARSLYSAGKIGEVGR